MFGNTAGWFSISASTFTEGNSTTGFDGCRKVGAHPGSVIVAATAAAIGINHKEES
jgi:hypothetical protein